MLKGAIFDFDGTLVDSMFIWDTIGEDYLRSLKENGARMCIATVTDRYLVEETLDRLGILQYFSEIFTCAEVGYGKDKPIIYRKALEHLDTAKNETYVFEDSLFALKTAKADGFTTVGVYDRHENRQDNLKNLADYYIVDFADPVLKTI